LVLLLSPELRTQILVRSRVLAHAFSPRTAAIPLPAGAQDATAILVDGDLRDWPRLGVRTEVAGDPIDFPTDTTDCRIAHGRNDLTSIKFGRSGDRDAFMVNGLLHLCRMPGPLA